MLHGHLAPSILYKTISLKEDPQSFWAIADMRTLSLVVVCLTLAYGQKSNSAGEKDFLLMKDIVTLCSRYCESRPQPDCKSKPAVYAPLDEIKGTISPGVGVDVELNGDPTLVDGHKGKAIHTPNSGTYDDNFMNLGRFEDKCINNVDKCTDGYTVSFWYKKDPGNHQYPVLGSASDWQIWTEDSRSEPGKSNAYYSWFKNDGRRSVGGGSKLVKNGEWHHIALVARSRVDVSFYLDGEELPKMRPERLETITHKTIEFGCYKRKNCISAAFDEIKIWEEAKSDAEIMQIFAMKKRR